ncbi:MAG: hypothetical protein ACTHMM_17810 [Agriterribacter sp.]
MIDLVYVLGTGSKWQDNELRYSLRSVEKHLSGYGQLYIVGSCPDWVTNAVHIQMADEFGYNRDKNIYSKIYIACRQKKISDNFLFINDDHFFLQNFVADQVPYYHKGDLFHAFNSRPHADHYRVTLSNTYWYLKRNYLPTNHFDVHTPIIYNKRAFISAVSIADWDVYYGYGIKSLYANSLKIAGEQTSDCKVDSAKTRTEIVHRINDRPFFSIGDNALNDDMKSLLEDLYPVPSSWEN